MISEFDRFCEESFSGYSLQWGPSCSFVAAGLNFVGCRKKSYLQMAIYLCAKPGMSAFLWQCIREVIEELDIPPVGVIIAVNHDPDCESCVCEPLWSSSTRSVRTSVVRWTD